MLSKTWKSSFKFKNVIVFIQNYHILQNHISSDMVYKMYSSFGLMENSNPRVLSWKHFSTTTRLCCSLTSSSLPAIVSNLRSSPTKVEPQRSGGQIFFTAKTDTLGYQKPEFVLNASNSSIIFSAILSVLCNCMKQKANIELL